MQQKQYYTDYISMLPRNHAGHLSTYDVLYYH